MAHPFKYVRLEKDDAACLLVDHQSGLISLVQDFSPGEFKNNVLALGASAKYLALAAKANTLFLNSPGEKSCTKEMSPDW